MLHLFSLGILAIPYLLWGGMLFVGWRKARPGSANRWLLGRYPVLVGGFAGVALGVYGVMGILSSHSSTAVVGFFFIPFWMIGVGLLGWLLTLLVNGAIHLTGKGGGNPVRTGAVGALLTLGVLGWGAFLYFGHLAREGKAASQAALAVAASPALKASDVPSSWG